ncbi:MAG: ribosome maturation factor RimM [Anaerolineales bacterium]|jgi:16S rRNA processing protein RimM|nr:ribosome maturation factor RimM [Anaerolineales bacterium]
MSRRLSPVAKLPTAGAAQPDQPAFLAIGKLRRPHGVRGEIIMEILTDFPERLRRGAVLYVGEAHQPVHLTSLRPNDKTLLVSLEGYTTPEAIGAFRNQIVYVTAADRPALPEGEYYHHQLIGLRVVTDDGRQLGVVREILETGANDVLVVRPNMGAEILLPAIDPVILQVNLEQGEMQVHLLPGLIDQVDEERDDDAAANSEG